MAAPDRRASTDIDRRASMQLATPRSPDDHDYDDYDLEASGVADGIRPADVANHARIPSITTTPHHHDPSHGRRTPPPRPSSTTKPNRNSFTLRHDGAMGPVASRNPTVASAASAIPTRSSSISTDAAFVRAESPYRGPAGPSHPYQMYAQDAPVARTMSVTTASTIQVPERSYQGPSGPTHPYGMYPQNTVPESDTASNPSEPVIAGFPGLNNEYRRRLGPEGEEVADIIGPDGHTEQLPPYSKYPDEALARKARATVPEPPPGAGGIGLATRDPEFSSVEDLHAPPSRRSTRSMMSDSTNHTHQTNQSHTAPFATSEKRQLKKWQRIARKRICGIVPIWAIVLVVVTLILFVLIVLGVLVALWHRHAAQKHHVSNNGTSSPPSTSMTTTLDASPLASVPTNMPPLPTGTFSLPISTPSVAPNTCLPAPQSNAWSCQISPILPYQIEVSAINGASPLSDYDVLLGLGNNSIAYLPYGAQPPVLNRPQVLNLALDNYDTKRGPAWFFQALYDKVVIVQESGLTMPGSSSKRASVLPERDTISDFSRKGVAQPGEYPWFCYWNSTLLEAFIYVNDTSIAGSKISSSSTTSPTSSTYSSTSTAAPYAPPPPVFLPFYAKVVKIEEHRVSSVDLTTPPYCVKHYITGDGIALPQLDGTGKPITLYLNETEPSVAPPLVSRHTLLDSIEGYSGRLDERTSSASCGCAWMAQ